jgi:23S rRNA (adenine2503-C2)-methyltransferase
MPVNRRWPLVELTAALRRYPLPRRRRITVEYVLLGGLNDSPADARRLVRLLDRVRVKVNLIAYNPGPGDPAAADPELPLRPPDPERVEAFAEALRRRNVNTHLRRSRGGDIAAACGQLAGG